MAVVRRTQAGLYVLILTLFAAALPARATNGMYLVGYGAESVGRGGANLAISDRSLALNFNPAGLSQLQGNHFAMNLSVLAPSLEFRNAANRKLDAEDSLFPLPAFTYVRGSKESPWVWGVGFVGQGGMGATFKHQNTFFGTQDETFSEVRFATLSPTVSYSVNDDMALGLTANLGYADASFRFFPRTSFFNVQNPAQSFFGVDLDRAGGLQTSLRAGWWWRPRPKVAVGLIYQTKTRSRYEDGTLLVNFNAHPQLRRTVRYDAKIDGFTFAAQAGLGLAFKPTDDWVLAIDAKRYFWDGAMNTVTVTAENPNVAGAPARVVLPFVFDWKDQWVLAVGGDYRWNEQLTLRAGYNYGSNPVPSRTLTPLFPAITEQHLSVGGSWLTRSGKVIELAVERAFNQTQTNDNTDPQVNPFGPGARVDHSQWTVSLGISYAWERR